MENASKLILVVLDGFGLRADPYFNAIIQANTPVFDTFWQLSPRLSLNASGESVGLPWGEMGNSEVGHINLGSGRVVLSDYSQISGAIKNRSFFQNPLLRNAIAKVKKNNCKFHIVGILSDGGIHGHIDHIIACAKLIAEAGLEPYIHIIADGRDSAPKAILKFVEKLEKNLEIIGKGRIVTVAGRYYSMDRDKRWDRTILAYNAMIEGTGVEATTVNDAINEAYKRGESDEFIKPTVIGQKVVVQDGDAVLFTNFRADRALQLTKVFVDKQFTAIKRKLLSDIDFMTMTEYEHGLGAQSLFSVVDLNNLSENPLSNPLGEVVSDAGFTQFHAAESEKKAHVTYFFNAGREKPFKGEDTLIVPSPKVATYNLQPEMSAPLLCEGFLKNVAIHDFKFSLINFANADMVGHTGDLKATIKAVETVDLQINKIVDFIRDNDYQLLITADHGNAEFKKDHDSESISKEHTTNPVPLLYINSQQVRNIEKYTQLNSEEKIKNNAVKPIGLLADVAPTIIDILSLKKPNEMTGQSLKNLLIPNGN